jgi:uncharacterized LabA/DUF88 family protein
MLDSYGIFIDGDNIHPKYYPFINNLIRERGRIIFKKVYGDFSEEPIKQWKKTCQDYGIEPVQAWRERNKNSSDMKMITEIMDYLYRCDYLHHYVIVSGDIDFKELCKKIIENNKIVIGISCFEQSTSKILKNFCTEYIILNNEQTVQKLMPISDIKTTIENILIDHSPISLSVLKIKLLNINPLFNEINYGFKSFKHFLSNSFHKQIQIYYDNKNCLIVLNKSNNENSNTLV